MTGGSALKETKDARVTASRELAAAICVNRCNAEPDSASKLVELKALSDSYKKRQFTKAEAGQECRSDFSGQQSLRGLQCSVNNLTSL